MAELLLEDANVSKEQAAALARRAHRDAEHRAAVAARIMLRSAFASTARWAFAEWCAHVKQKTRARVGRATREPLRRAVGRMRGNLARRALDGWRAWVDECAATREVGARAGRWRGCVAARGSSRGATTPSNASTAGREAGAGPGRGGASRGVITEAGVAAAFAGGERHAMTRAFGALRTRAAEGVRGGAPRARGRAAARWAPRGLSTVGASALGIASSQGCACRDF